VSHLRDQGREAEADRRADAWNREIARALGEAEALRRTTAATRENLPRPERHELASGYLALLIRRPAQALTLTAAALFAFVATARLIDAVTPELLTTALVALIGAPVAKRCQARRRGDGRGRR
jgi:hypothetical protein